MMLRRLSSRAHSREAYIVGRLLVTRQDLSEIIIILEKMLLIKRYNGFGPTSVYFQSQLGLRLHLRTI